MLMYYYFLDNNLLFLSILSKKPLASRGLNVNLCFLRIHADLFSGFSKSFELDGSVDLSKQRIVAASADIDRRLVEIRLRAHSRRKRGVVAVCPLEQPCIDKIGGLAREIFLRDVVKLFEIKQRPCRYSYHEFLIKSICQKSLLFLFSV